MGEVGHVKLGEKKTLLFRHISCCEHHHHLHDDEHHHHRYHVELVADVEHHDHDHDEEKQYHGQSSLNILTVSLLEQQYCIFSPSSLPLGMETTPLQNTRHPFPVHIVFSFPHFLIPRLP